MKNGEPLDELVYCEVMFDENISGEHPEHADFIYNTAIPYFEQHGMQGCQDAGISPQQFYDADEKYRKAYKARAAPAPKKHAPER